MIFSFGLLKDISISSSALDLTISSKIMLLSYSYSMKMHIFPLVDCTSNISNIPMYIFTLVYSRFTTVSNAAFDCTGVELVSSYL